MSEFGRRGSGPIAWSGKGSDARFRVIWLSEVDSTNRYALDAARDGEPAGLVVVADRQHAGRGRLGRTWEASSGSSLLVSVLLRPRRRVDELHLCTAAVALAMRGAVRDTAGFHPALKWPNDLLADGRKLGGVLAEADLGATGSVHAVVVGVGVNVSADAIPPALEAASTACEAIAGRPVDRRLLLDAFLARLGARLDTPDATLMDEYRARLATLGVPVRVERATDVIEGVARDVDDLGCLIVVTPDARTVTISAGDVVHLRPA